MPMSDQSAFSLSQKSEGLAALEISPADEKILRELAARLAELADRESEQHKRKLWYRHNDLAGSRPLIFCDPENGWNEIILSEDLQCQGELARDWEMRLRKEIFWAAEMGDDRVAEPVFDINYSYQETGWGMKERKIGGEDGGSYSWDPPLKDYQKDFERLEFPEIRVDYHRTERIKEIAEEILGDFLEVRIKGSFWWTLGMTWTAINLRGLERFMLDTYENPDYLHRLMKFLRDGHLAKLDFLEENGLLSLNNDGTYVGSGGFGYTRELPRDDFAGEVRTVDMWGFAESQETTCVSPEMFAEFVFQYQLPILERFGLNCYGCCEPLDKRWKYIKQVPNLRRVSVSPWADVAEMAGHLEDNYIFSYKPMPADLAVPEINEEKIRENIREVLHQTEGCHLEIIMKDNHTIGNNPDNVKKWCRIAREEIDKFC